MSLCINPQETIIRVAVNGGFVVLEVKAPTAEQERAVCQKPSAADLGGTDHAGRAGRGAVAVDGTQPA